MTKPNLSGKLLLSIAAFLVLSQAAAALDRTDCMKDPDYCKTLIQNEPDDIDLLLLRAAGYESQEKWDLAIDDYSTAIGLDSDDPDLYVRKGRAEERANKSFGASISYSKAMVLDPKNIEYALLAARSTCSQNDFDSVLKKAPKNADAYLMAAICSQRPGSTGFIDLERAERLETQAITLNPDFGAARYNRALLYVAKHSYGRALADLDSLEKIDPDNADVYTLKGVIRGAQGDNAGAIKEHGKAIVADPLGAQRYLFRARVLYNAGQMDAALADAKRALMLDGKNASAYQTKGKIEEAMGNKSGADLDLKVAAGPAYMRTALTSMETQPTVPRDDSGDSYTSMWIILATGALVLGFFMFRGKSAGKSRSA